MGRELELGKLPEDIFDHLYSLVPLEDAARAACVSRGFLRSWRRHPRLVFNYKTLGLDRFCQTEREGTLASTDERDDGEHRIESYLVNKIDRVLKICSDIGVVKESYLVNKIDRVLKNRSDIGVMKAFTLHLHACPNMEASYVDYWLQFALKPGVEKLALEMSLLEKRAEYNFPCSLLSNETGVGSLQSLRLASCAFHRTALGCHKSLTSLHLRCVRITGKELGRFASNCHALAKLLIYGCDGIIYLRVPGVLWHLNHFHVAGCKKLRVVEISAPKLSSFVCGENLPQISLGAKEVKHITVRSSQPNTICYARTNLPSFMPAVERVTVESLGEAYPALETFILDIQTDDMLVHDSVFRDLDGGAQLHLRQLPECWHHNLKNVRVTGFTYTKGLIEFTRYIVQNSLVLECMTLDTASGCGRRSTKRIKCAPMSEGRLREARKAVEAVRTCIEGTMRPSTNLKAMGPCSQCGYEGSSV